MRGIWSAGESAFECCARDFALSFMYAVLACVVRGGGPGGPFLKNPTGGEVPGGEEVRVTVI